jgi:hypothetical protein
MWKKIGKSSTTESVRKGSIITTEPNNDRVRYEIQSIQNNYIRAIHADGKICKGFPAEKLISDNWWIQE